LEIFKMKKKVLIAGASGLVGGEILNLLDNKNLDITLLSRRLLNLNMPDIKEYILDFDRIETSEDFPSVDHVYIALGKRLDTSELIYIRKDNRESFIKVDHDYVIALAKKAFAMGAKSISIVSAIGVNKDSKNLYLKTKGAVEEEIKLIGYDHVVIAQPGHLLGIRPEDRLRIEVPIIEFFTKIIKPLMIGPLRDFRNISAQEVASSIIAAMQGDVIGVTTLTYKDFIKN